MGKIADCIRGVALPEQKKIKMLALDQEFSDMEAEIKSLKSENLHLQAQVNPLEKKVERLEQQLQKESADDLTFDQRTGTYTESGSNLRYCAKCFSGGKRQPLRDTGHGWHCMVCGARPIDPSRKQGPTFARTDYDPFNPGDPNDWMR